MLVKEITCEGCSGSGKPSTQDEEGSFDHCRACFGIGTTLIDGPVELDGYHLLLGTCASPEQWDVFKDDRRVGFLRIRHGLFCAYAPNISGDLVFQSLPKGDGELLDEEREGHIRAALAAITRHIGRGSESVASAGTTPQDLMDMTLLSDGRVMRNEEEVPVPAEVLREVAARLRKQDGLIKIFRGAYEEVVKKDSEEKEVEPL